jgi:F-type H+-transporting ATPase subunit b
MHTVIVTFAGAGGLEANLPMQAAATEGQPSPGPSPIAPEAHEIIWGGGAFIAFFLLMRLVLFPRVKQGMVARYNSIADSHTEAEATRAAARQEVAAYQADLAAIKAEAAVRVDDARRTLEAERAARHTELNRVIAERKDASAVAATAAREAIRPDVEVAAGDLAAQVTEMAIGRRPADSAVAEAVSLVASGGNR